MPAEVSPPTNTTTAEGSMAQATAKPAIKNESPILKPKFSSKVTKKTSSRCVKYVAAKFEAIKAKYGATKAPGTRTPRKLPQGPRHRSQRITESKQGPAQSQMVVGSAGQEVEGGLAEAAPPKEKTAEEPKGKTRSPISKPGAGVRDSKRGDRSGRRGNGGGGRARHGCH